MQVDMRYLRQANSSPRAGGKLNLKDWGRVGEKPACNAQKTELRSASVLARGSADDVRTGAGTAQHRQT